MPDINAKILKQFRETLTNCANYQTWGPQALNEHDLIMLAIQFYNQGVLGAYEHLFGPQSDTFSEPKALLLKNTKLDELLAANPTPKKV